MTETISSETQSQGWDDCRKKVRKLEGELDVKLAAFSKLCMKYDGSSGASALAEETLDTKASELDSLLRELEGLNTILESIVENKDQHGHALSRHRDILSEYVQERERLQNAYVRIRGRIETLDLKSDTTPLLGVQIQGASGTLLRERATLHSASVGIDEVISQATAIADDVKLQGNLFGRISNRLTEVAAKYPVVGGLLRSISRRKSRDAIILSVVVATCLVLVIAYVLWK